MKSFLRELAWISGLVLAIAAVASVVTLLIVLAVYAFSAGAVLGGVLYVVAAFVVYVFSVTLSAHLLFKNREH